MSTDLKSSAVITTTALDADGLSTAAAVGNNAALTLQNSSNNLILINMS